MLSRLTLIAAFAALVAFAAPAPVRAAPVLCPDIEGAVTRTDIVCALNRWIDTANSHNPNAVTNLYAGSDVLLLSTLQADPFTNTGQIRQYFQGLVTRPNFQVVALPTIPPKVDVLGRGGAVSGFYRFSWTGQSTPARYSFVFVQDGRRLVIATHHSSKLP